MEYTFIIDTDSYSGNFEREMFAYATGYSYDYNPPHADTLCALIRKELGLKQYEEHFITDLVEERAHDEYGMRPMGMDGCNGVTFFLSKKPTQDEINFLKERCEKVTELIRQYKYESDKQWDKNSKFENVPLIKIIGYRLLETKTIYKYTNV